MPDCSGDPNEDDLGRSMEPPAGGTPMRDAATSTDAESAPRISDRESGIGPLALLLQCGPGLTVAAVVALAAKFLEIQGFGPALMIALIGGLRTNFIAADPIAKPGIQFAAKHVLAGGVALLGARLTLADVSALGIAPALVVAAGMALTLGGSWLFARALGLGPRIAILAGCGTAICGASAAVAAASVLPRNSDLERDTTVVVVTVVALSAIAMIGYPILAMALGLSDTQAGILLGGSIHNVPQAVGAGYAVSEAAGNTATLTKLFRVSLLAPIVVGIAILFGAGGGTSIRKLGVPWFIIVFVLLVIAGSVLTIPQPVRVTAISASNWLLLIAIAAIGMNTSLLDIRKVGAPVLLLVLLNSLVLVSVLLCATVLDLV